MNTSHSERTSVVFRVTSVILTVVPLRAGEHTADSVVPGFIILVEHVPNEPCCGPTTICDVGVPTSEHTSKGQERFNH